MKNKILIILLIIFLFILFAIPIPISIFGFFFSFIWVLGSLMEGLSFLETTTVLCGLIIIATYILTYIFALIKTCEETKISIKTFLPIAHCLLFMLFLLYIKPINNYIDKTTPYFGFAKKDFSVSITRMTKNLPEKIWKNLAFYILKNVSSETFPADSVREFLLQEP